MPIKAINRRRPAYGNKAEITAFDFVIKAERIVDSFLFFKIETICGIKPLKLFIFHLLGKKKAFYFCVILLYKKNGSVHIALAKSLFLVWKRFWKSILTCQIVTLYIWAFTNPKHMRTYLSNIINIEHL